MKSLSLASFMRPWALPKGMTRDQFNDLVAHLYDLLAANGLDPSSHLSVGDFDEIIDGKICPHFALFISDTVAQILKKQIKLKGCRSPRLLWLAAMGAASSLPTRLDSSAIVSENSHQTSW